jgi:hypothetical protein
MKYLILLTLFLGSITAAYCNDTNSSETDPIIARVHGRDIRLSEQQEMNGIIFGSLMKKYAENSGMPSQADIDAFVERGEQMDEERRNDWEAERVDLSRKLESDALSESDRAKYASDLQCVEKRLKTDAAIAEISAADPEQTRKTNEQIAETFVRAWKVNLSLYEQYGGRVIFQQAGVEPLDAYLYFLKDQEAAGNFQILDKQYEGVFWNYFTNETMHTFYPADEGDKFMRTPWWLEKAEE